MTTWRKAEAALGLLAVFLLGASSWIVPPFAALGIFLEGEPWLGFLAIAAGLAAIPPFVWVVRAAGRHMDVSPRRDPDCPPAHIPLALSMALQVPTAPWPARTIVGVWWLAHFLAGAAIAHFIFRQLGELAPKANPIVVGLLLLAQFAWTFAANVYLLLAGGAFTPRSLTLVKLWRCRFLIDLGLVAAMLAAWRK